MLDDSHEDSMGYSAAYTGRPPGDKDTSVQSVDFDMSYGCGLYTEDFQKEAILMNVLSKECPETTMIKAVKTIAKISAPDGRTIEARVLMDSGALHTNYIGRDFLQKNFKHIKQCLRPCNGIVVLADGITKIPVKEYAELSMIFEGEHRKIYQLTDKFMVMDSREDIIIGLPTILSKLLPKYIEMLKSVKIPRGYVNPHSADASLGVIIEEPWSNLDITSPEEEETPLPCAFTDALHYLSLSREEAIAEYKALLDSHVTEDMKKHTKIMDLLVTDLALRVFIPERWEGIKGIPPLEIKFKEGMPESFKPPNRPINPKLFENAKKEFERLLGYFYEPSDSPIASPLVVAPKNSPPFLRFCGDYSVFVNKYIETGHYPIPHVFRMLEKISRFEYFFNADLTNAFHQNVLHPDTARKLSVQTPWGQVQPKFLPEGVPPGSGVLQKVVEDVFRGFEEWTICIFDNLLVLGNSLSDIYDKTVLILRRCDERGVVLKMKKSYIGVTETEFFGYWCSKGSFRLTDERKQSIYALPMPANVKQMRRFLGCSGFFHKFVPNFASLVAPLSDMIKSKFDWNPETWKVDYVKIFENFKQKLYDAVSLYYPDYNLDWFLRADASDYGIGFVLLQKFINKDGTIVMQPLVFGSKKFSEQALKWSTYAKEAYAMFYAFKACEYYLRAKPFMYEGDHANLRWMEQSAEAKVIRWRIYMQSFPFKFNHIPGKENIVADWQSRFCNSSIEEESEYSEEFSPLDVLTALSAEDEEDTELSTQETPVEKDSTVNVERLEITKEDMLKAVHGNRNGHMGVKRTFDFLNERFPGHGISQKEISDFLDLCPTCQANSKARSSKLVPITRHLKVPNPRDVVGIDYLSLVRDKFGNDGLYIMRDHFTKLCYFYPTAVKDAHAAAMAVFSYCILYGKYDTLISDPGSEFTSESMALLNAWFGIHHRVSLVDRHESNGVEGCGKQALRHLRNLNTDEILASNKAIEKMLSLDSVKDVWSSPHVLGWASYMMNKLDISESGICAFDLTFGTDARKYFDFPSAPLNAETAPEYLKILDKNLRELRKASREYQLRLVEDRQKNDLPQNMFQPGDFVLHEVPKDKPRTHKLRGPYTGPYVVQSQYRNDVEVKHLSIGNVFKFHVSTLKPFRGDKDTAIALAHADRDQYLISAILGYRGDPLRRTSMEFYVRFADGEELWIPWSNDLFDSAPYEDYCRLHRELIPLVYRLPQASAWIRRIKNANITAVSPGKLAYVDLRAFGAEWFEALALPELHLRIYFVQCEYREWIKPQKKIRLRCVMLNRDIIVDNMFVTMYGSIESINPERNDLYPYGITIVDEQLVKQYPALLSDIVVREDPESFKYLIGSVFEDEGRLLAVTRISVTAKNDIVAFVKPAKGGFTSSNKEDPIPYHVRSVVDLVKSFEQGGKKGGVV